ncbi:MAG: N-acetylmuramoyl-L-alanine amidase [Bacteroidota bacterium]
MKNILFLFVIFSVACLHAQHLEIELLSETQMTDAALLKNGKDIFFSKTLTVPISNVRPFLAYSVTADYTDVEWSMSIRFSEDGENWKAFQEIQQDTHELEKDHQWVSTLMYAEAQDRFYQYVVDVEGNIAIDPKLVLHFYNPGDTEKSNETTDNELETRSCPCPQPAFEERLDWCPDGDCPKDRTPAPNSVSHLIVHHSAGVNSANDWAAVVRSIWDFHVNTRGWDDVGYNWLVDPNGVLYEGRGADLIGAHFCGANTGTEGICLLGNFTNITPKQAAVDKLVQFLAWKSCSESLYPIDRVRHNASGRNLLQVSGHRDGCATACPGDAFYPLFDEVRAATIEYIDNNCSISSILPRPYALTDSLMDNEAVELNWGFDLPSSNIQLSLERSVGENYRYEEIARLASDVNTFLDEDVTINQLYFYRLRALTGNEASAYSNTALVSTIISSTNQYLNEKNVQIFPNPVQDQLALQIENDLFGQLVMELQDMAGRPIRQQLFTKQQRQFQTNFDVSDLPKGFYLLRIEQAQERLSLRFSKQ